MQRNSTYRPLVGAIQLAVIVSLVVAALNYQIILDQYYLRTYQPTAMVAAYESRITLTPLAKAKFYRSNPQYDDKTSFNANCDTRPHELELGCYYRNRIYVLKIDNQSLASEMDVVTSHELLHAVWNSMDIKERNELVGELQSVYDRLDDKELQERMAGYAKSEPGEEANELHSILGTEYATLSPRLESHYAKYFTNRSQIVAAHAKYQSVFSSRRSELERELATIRSLKGQLAVMNRQLETYRSRGQIQQYNALVPSQNKLVDDINRRINTYHDGVEEYNALSKSLDSQEITDTEAAAQ